MIELVPKTVLGFVLFVAGIIGLLLNITVVSPVFQLAFSKDKSSIYVISSVNIVNDIAHLVITTFYLAPTIILNSFVFSDERNGHLTVFISFIFMFLWYIGNITQIVMAVNRFIVDHTVLSYSYFQIENIPNYTDQSDIPLNALSSIIPIVCYSWIFYTIRSAAKSITPNMLSENNKRRGRQELSYAMQFCLISMFYTFSWIMFRVFPIIFTGRQIEWFILTSLCHVFNCSANAFVYIVFNLEIRRRLSQNRFFRFTGIAITDHTHSHEQHTQSKVHTIPIPSARLTY
uniref:7TM_GPCR_Srx domain-containing protein n=1 Tax=Caenorhabditis tropicalis TaxID=1561998 RepID=A0A1I7UK96_9PELO